MKKSIKVFTVLLLFGSLITAGFNQSYAEDAQLGVFLQALNDELDERTPDKKTGKQEMDGNLQIILDKDANDASRFSIFRDGADGLQEEAYRVD